MTSCDRRQYNGIFWEIGTVIFCVAIVVGLLYARRSARKMGVHSKDTTVQTPTGPVTRTTVSTPATRGKTPGKKP